tara:strand:- start:1937 stop:2983 length:1047 start_codon:yes stop_codon:yes gene_type:complete
MKYIFILGRDPELSILEIKSYLNCKILHTSDIALVLETNQLDKNAIKHLGGTQKIAKVITEINPEITSNKIRYAVSNYTEEDDTKIKKQLKQIFKAEKVKATIKKSKQRLPFLSPTEAQNTFEIILYKNYIAETIQLFNPKDHKFRDLQRPEQRPLHTISIRLAKILVNLTGTKPKQTLLDPFCGIGTVLQEAMLQNINVIGADKSKKVTKQAKANLKWIQEQYKTKANYRILNLDATKISKQIKKVDSVATEPYLGPFWNKLPTDQEARRTIKELQPMYENTLRELKKITKKKIVIIAPVFRTRTRKHYKLLLEPTLKQLKLKYREPIMYSAPRSKILRQIWIINNH